MNPITFILLDSSRTTKDYIVMVDGVDTTQFEKNPVMFYLHQDFNLPIGRWDNIRKENGQLLADAVFDYEDTDPTVQRIIKKVEKGFIKMASCGLVELEVAAEPMLCGDGDYCAVVTNCRLREASILPVGGNHNALALRLYDNEGNEIMFGKESAALKLSDFIVKPKIEIMSKTYLKTLNLADNADDVAIAVAVEKLAADKAAADAKVLLLTDQVNTHETEKSNARKAEALNLVDTAVKDGRIDAKGKETFINLFDKDFDSAKTSLEAIPSRQSVKDQLASGSKTERETLNLMDWDALDKGGKLEKVKLEFNDLYVEKFEAKFHKKPNQ